MSWHLNIVSFDVPYPPDYGGVIDVFYKIKTLHNLGIKIHLHTFKYGREKSDELKKCCTSINYYERSSSPLHLFSISPYIVATRNNSTLIKNLNKNGFPVVFDGLHTTANLEKIKAKTYVRTHNIEHLLYFGHLKNEKNIFKKIFFFFEGLKLKNYEKILKKTNGIFTISPAEQLYFSEKFGQKSIYIPVFHKNNFKNHHKTKGETVVFHGNLKVPDNVEASLRLINIFKKTNQKLVIGSSFEHPKVTSKIKTHNHIKFVNTSKEQELENLLESAHVLVLLTNQKAGIKLKLLYSLYNGRFIIANNKMIEDSGLESLCIKANSDDEIIRKTEELFKEDFTAKNIEQRKDKLKNFSPELSAKKMIDFIFKG